MKLSRATTLLAILAAPAVARGEVGLLESGRLMEEGAISWSLPVTRNNFELYGTVIDAEPGFRAAVREGVEWGLSAPYRNDRTGEVEGLRFLHGVVKSRLGGTGSGYGALSLFGSIAPEESATGIGSGQNTLGFALHFSEYLNEEATALHSLFRLERSDSRQALEGGGSQYELVTKLRFGLGIEQSIASRGAFLLQSVVTIAGGDNAQKGFGLSLMPAYRHRFGNGLEVTLAGAVDMPRGGVEPERQYLINFTYTAAPLRPTRREMAQRLDAAENRIAELEARLVSAETGLTGLSGRTERHGSAIDALKGKTGVMAIEIIDASARAGLGERLAAALRAEGYLIVRTGVAEGPIQTTTAIRYREGMARAAIQLGHLLRHSQTVARGSELPPGVDAQVILGSDQE